MNKLTFKRQPCKHCNRRFPTNQMLQLDIIPYDHPFWICRRCESTAFHESAHAVIALYLGEEVSYINIAEIGDNLGNCQVLNGWFLHLLLSDRNKNTEISPKRRVRAENAILVKLSGIVAEERLRGKLPKYWVYQPDCDTAWKLVVELLSMNMSVKIT